MKKKLNFVPYNPKLKILARNLRNNSTKAEILLWHYLKGKQIKGYDFHRQKPVDNYILDFFCPNLMLGIELDGYSHNFDEIVEKDMKKELKMKELGIAILRFDDSEVMDDMDNVLRVIEGFIDEYEKSHP